MILLSQGSTVFADGSLEMTEPNTKHAFHQIQTHDHYIKATLANGNNLFWEPFGSDLGSNLSDTQSLTASFGARVALSNDGTIRAWGEPDFGGTTPELQNALQEKKVLAIASTGYAFAARLEDGSLFCWGEEL